MKQTKIDFTISMPFNVSYSSYRIVLNKICAHHLEFVITLAVSNFASIFGANLRVKFIENVIQAEENVYV